MLSKVKVHRCMSMLEWQTTTTDTEVTIGRQLHNMITITSTKNEVQRTMKDFANYFLGRQLQSQSIEDDDVEQPLMTNP